MSEILNEYGLLLLVGQFPNGPLGGLALTLILSVMGLALSFPLSIAIALCRMSPIRPLYVASTVLVYVVRGVPLVMFVFWGYFLVPILVGHSVTAFTAMICTLVVYQSAYLSEVIRAGIEALPKGQVEASRALGLGYWRTHLWVILPQALYNMVPSIISQLVSLIKETSIGYVISVQELTFEANQVNNALLTKPFEVFAILVTLYFVVCFVLTKCANYLESHVTRKRSPKAVVQRSIESDSIFEG
ncbi:amino acid ABC transporter permease [Pandoraea iniqua]|uniref:Amino acid ABC transporter permease n=1 Tax=Pandoraea iniqua TaxID=2508288 RepID=A0A5E4VFP2_9BURK|nr:MULTISPECIES: amino acid ABC transporter permease [Pandoraea]VVE10384.1 amino acid ABC transporter permease [Pandoraea iniqua]VVE18153.1 amino acid ABC transporter permease [Pandoraea iniqua]